MSIGKLSTRLLRWLLTASVIGATTTAMAQEDNCGLCHFASPATAENLIVEEQAVDACDYSDADQFSGWGWNAATSTSCPPLDSADTWVAVANEAPATPAHTATANCDYSNAADFDGWGWNNNTGTSCPPLESEETQLVAQNDNPFTSATNTTTPICISASSDPDGDGWGWENNRTCQIVALNAVPVTDNSNACIDTDGDGWGWDGSQSSPARSALATTCHRQINLWQINRNQHLLPVSIPMVTATAGTDSKPAYLATPDLRKQKSPLVHRLL